MEITRELIEQGMTYEQYKAQMVENRNLLMEAEQQTILQIEDLQYFSHLPQTVHVLVLTEDWCSPSTKSIPVLAQLADKTGKLQLRFFLRDQNLDIMDQYRKDGVYRSIPTFIFFDHDFHELGHWQELPAKIEEMMNQMDIELFASDPALVGLSMETPFCDLPERAQERIRAAYKEFWVDNQQLFNDEVARETRAIVEVK